jgi:tripartite-type tricarboxylate transporter receptor subunit TctC
MRSRFLSALACSAWLLCSSCAWAQFPNRPVTIVVPFPGGTASDLVTRILATEMGASMGQPVVVQNRPGGNSAIGAASVATAAADGHTLLLATAGTVALPSLVKNLPYDTLQDLVPISMVSRFVLFAYVNAELPVNTLAELMDWARANPGKLNYATGNPVGIVASAQMIALAGKPEMVHVPYKGEPSAVIDLASNRVQWMFSSPSSAENFVKSGKLRVLATNLPQRSVHAPNVASVNEYFPKFSVTAWAGLMAPKGTPKEIVDRLSREVASALNKPQVKERLDRLQYVGVSSTPEELGAFFKDQVHLYSRLLRESGVQPE